MSDFMTWVAPGTMATAEIVKELKQGLEALGAVEAELETVKEALHLQVGDMLKKAVGAVDTKDVYGGGPEEHGSPYKIEGEDKRQLVGRFLRSKGYRPSGEGKWTRGQVLVELGFDPKQKTTFIYVTDDGQK